MEEEGRLLEHIRETARQGKGGQMIEGKLIAHGGSEVWSPRSLESCYCLSLKKRGEPHDRLHTPRPNLCRLGSRSQFDLRTAGAGEGRMRGLQLRTRASQAGD